jgi:uncharacterized protein YecE (DUF72 family)
MAYFIGTSGWSYEHWFNGVFYPRKIAKSRAFNYYQTKFNTVELNVTYYRLLPVSTFEGWFKKTPEDFVFAAKGSRYITQNKKLANIDEPVERFFERADKLQNKAGPILWQFGHNFKKHTVRLEGFLSLLPKNYRHAFEFRHESWFDDEIYDLLRKNNAALVFADSLKWPLVEEVTADFIYIRFHGGKELYGSKYSKEELINWSVKFKKWHSQGLDIYAYFNNDYKGFAPKNALDLKSLVEGNS